MDLISSMSQRGPPPLLLSSLLLLLLLLQLALLTLGALEEYRNLRILAFNLWLFEKMSVVQWLVEQVGLGWVENQHTVFVARVPIQD